MKNVVSVAVLWCAVLACSAAAAPIAVCNTGFSQCYIPENIQLMLPFAAIAGDVKLVESDGVTVSDVFRISNNLINTGGGTGLGNLVFLFSVDDGPLPTTLSANVQTIQEAPNGFTPFNGNGTIYLLGVPEPATFGLLGIALILLGVRGSLHQPKHRNADGMGRVNSEVRSTSRFRPKSAPLLRR